MKRLLLSCLLLLANGGGLLRAQTPAATNDVIVIEARSFDYNQQTGLAVWTGNVRVVDSQMKLTCEELTGKFGGAPGKTNDAATASAAPASPISGGRIESFLAEREVVMISLKDQSRATGAKAVYNAATDLVELTGNPMLQSPQGKMWADVITLDRGSNKLAGRGNIRMEIRGGAFAKTNSVVLPTPGSLK